MSTPERLAAYRRYDAMPERKRKHAERVKASYHALDLAGQFALASNRYVRLTLNRSETIEASRLTTSAECFYCWSEPTGWDHVIPLSRGGAHSEDNLVPCCLLCNVSKGNRTPEEWLAKGLVQGRQAYDHAWRAAHPGYSKAYREANRERLNAYCRARRAAKKVKS